MKYFTSLKFLLSALMLCLTIGAQAGEVVFNGTTDTNGKSDAGEDQLTKSGVTLSVSRGLLASYNGQYRTFKGETLTISSTVGVITRVVFTCTAKDNAQYGPGCYTVATGDYSYEGYIGTWTGDANEVVFKAETNQVRATEIVVTVNEHYHRLILTANEGGTITYNGKTIKNSSATFDIIERKSATITVEPYEKYKLVSLKMNGINVKKYMEGNTFTTDEIDGDVEIVATFDLIDPYITITPTNKLQTFCSEDNLNFSEVSGLTAYIVVGYKPSAKELLLTPVIEVPAGTGVLLKGEVGKTYKVPTMENSDYNYSNALVGVLEDEEVTTGFVFDETFKAVDGSTVVPANTAYLLIPAATEAGISELKGYLTDGPAVKGDLNGDGMADISDVVYLVNLILGQ